MTINQCLLFPYRRSAFFVRGLTADLSPADWLFRPVDGAQCAAWIVGHLITVEHSALTRLGGSPPALPDSDFDARHGMGAKPAADADYGDVSRLIPLFDAQRAMMIDFITDLPAAEFDRPIEHPMFKVLGELLGLIPIHTTLHCGQLSTIRRALGKPPLF